MANKKNSKSNKKGKTSKNRSAYILFSMDKRNQLKNENPGSAQKLVLSELGALWKAADPQTKQYFQKLADNEKVQTKGKAKSNKNKKNSKSNKENQSNNEQSMDINSS